MEARGHHDVEAEWFMPHDPVVLVLSGLAQARWVSGDLVGASDALGRGVDRIGELIFPQGPFSLCYLRFVEVFMRLEAGEFDRAVELAAEIPERSERHGFDQWVAMGATLHRLALAMAAQAVGEADSQAVTDGINAMIGWTAACRYVGALSFLTTFDGYAARLLISAGRLDEARAQIDAGLALAGNTGMHCYDAELLRLKAATLDDRDAGAALLQSATELARKQKAPVFILRAALDDHRLRGEVALQSVADAVTLFPADSTWPELTRARALLN
jgi:hypothetical protein